MLALVNLYRRLDLIQRKLVFRVAASVLLFALCGGVFGVLLAKSYDLHGQRLVIVSTGVFGSTEEARIAHAGSHGLGKPSGCLGDTKSLRGNSVVLVATVGEHEVEAVRLSGL